MQSFFNGLSGMLSFSKGIDVLSQNIANMNTPGYKGSNAIFRNFSGGDAGIGSSVVGTELQRQAGDYQDTGNATTLAIDGEGYFVLQDSDGKNFYTRAGQFTFNDNLELVDSTGNYNVMALDDAGNLAKVSFSDLKIMAPEATTQVQFSGQLASSDSEHTVSDIKVFDASGKSHTISVEFSNQGSNTWQAEVFLDDGTSVGTQQVQFNLDGSPLDGSNVISQDLTFDGTTQTIEFSLGEGSSFANAIQVASGTSNLGATVEDGSATSGYTSIEFDELGQIKVTYSNGEEQSGQRIAIASFNDISKLTHAGNGLYQATTSQMEIGVAGEGVNGKILAGKLELSNVELTEQFAQLLIAQQGYSASSRVMNVANQLLDTLYNNTGGR